MLSLLEGNRYKGSGCSHFEFGKASISLLVYASTLCNKVCYFRTPHFYCCTVAEHQCVIAASIQCTGEYLFYKYLHLGLEGTLNLFGVSLQIYFRRLGNDLKNLVLCLFVLTPI